jgi:D-arginine dehydrogenase
VPAATRFVVIGAGFAGAATAWALARAGLGPGVVLEREATFGMHASGRNAAIIRLVESDPIVRALARRSRQHMQSLHAEDLWRPTGAFTVASKDDAGGLEQLRQSLCAEGFSVTPLSQSGARSRFPGLDAISFDTALWSADEGVADIHGLLSLYLRLAKKGGFRLHTSSVVEDLIIEGGRVRGVYAGERAIHADMVIDACGAWAGRIGRHIPLALQPYRRHLFVTGPVSGWHRDAPVVWVFEAELYARPEGTGLLMSPCDQTPYDIGTHAASSELVESGLSRTLPYEVDHEAIDLLAHKLAAHAPGFMDVELRRGWSCLRTFAPDRRPVIGPDPDVPGLFHVSGLGGFGVTASAGIGELAAALISDGRVDWVDAASVSPGRPAMKAGLSSSADAESPHPGAESRHRAPRSTD